jgi:plastocyanin
MRRHAAAAVIAAALLLPGAATAAVPVSVQFAAFGPDRLDVLPGETVVWTNTSERTHTVTADDGSFASGDLPGAGTFTHAFDQVGSFAYHCTIHPSMTGEVDVRRVTLDPLPTASIAAGTAVAFTGRTADPGTPVRIERAQGPDFAVVASVTPGPDGTWSTTIRAARTGGYRAASDQGTSETRRLLVQDRRVVLRATRGGVRVTVTPARPYGHVVLQEELRDRFGWWTVARGQLDYVSQATFAVVRPARVRVALVGADQWTPLATSPVLTLGRPPRGPAGPKMQMRR